MHSLCWWCYSLLKSTHFLLTSLSHNININCLTVTISLHCFCFKAYITTFIKSQISIITSVSFICIFCVQYWYWLQSHLYNNACDCEKHTALSSVSVTSVKHAHIAVTASLSLLFEEVNSLHTSVSFIFFLITVTLLISHSCDFLIALIHLCCLQCSKVIVTLTSFPSVLWGRVSLFCVCTQK